MRLELRRKLWPYRSLSELADTLGVSLAVLKRRLRELQSDGNLSLEALARSCGRTTLELDRAFLFQEPLPRASVQVPNMAPPSSIAVPDDHFFEDEGAHQSAQALEAAIEGVVWLPDWIQKRAASASAPERPAGDLYSAFHDRNLCLVCGNRLNRDTDSKVGWGEFLVCGFCSFSVHENADFEQMREMAQNYVPAQTSRVVAERSRRRTQIEQSGHDEKDL